MKFKSILGAAALASGLLGALPANANTYDFSYETAGGLYYGSGTFT